MAGEPSNLREIYLQAEAKRARIESAVDSNTSSYQEDLSSTIDLYEQCIRAADRISLFSSNEALDDIASHDLPYLLLNFHLAELIIRINGQDRHAILRRARRSYEQYLERLDNYDILSKDDARLLETYRESANTFSTAASSDPATKRDLKIRRFKAEKEVRQKLEYLKSHAKVEEQDEQVVRDLYLTEITYATHKTFQALESAALEFHILSLAPPPSAAPGREEDTPVDERQRGRATRQNYSERLDMPHLSAGLTGPLLDRQGKPLRPFTLTSKRQEFRSGVFRPDHSLPTMSIDEYLEEERRRGGMIEGGGAQSGIKPEVDEDDMEAADRATMKAREWDEYVEANPKGSGNTLNRG